MVNELHIDNMRWFHPQIPEYGGVSYRNCSDHENTSIHKNHILCINGSITDIKRRVWNCVVDATYDSDPVVFRWVFTVFVQCFTGFYDCSLMTLLLWRNNKDTSIPILSFQPRKKHAVSA